MLPRPCLAAILALVLPIAAASSGPEEERSQAAPAGVLTRAPQLKRFVEAPYPPEALASGASGSVVLSLVIDERGEVTKAVVVDPGPHPAFAAAALHAAVQFEFEPAEIDGKPAAVEITYRYEFVIRHEALPPQAEAPIALSGRVVERGTRRPVAGVTVEAGSAVAQTDREGRFELRGLAPGRIVVRVVSPDHEPLSLTEEVLGGRQREIEVRLTRRRYDPFEAVVRGERESKDVSVRTLHLDEVRSLPGTQGDTLKVIQDFPGVARAPYGLGLLVVRGSPPQDTRVYLDGVEIPILFHFGALTSVVDSEVLSTLDFFPGNFGAKYGRAMGGTVDVSTRDGKRELHGDAQLDVYDGRLLLEGPLGDGSAFGAVRRSWIDAVLAVALPHIAPQTAAELQVAPRYYDYQAKASQPFLGGTASVMVYGTDDALVFAQSGDPPGRPTLRYETAFHRLALHWRRPLGDAVKNDVTLALGYDHLDLVAASNFGALTDIRSITARDSVVVRVSPSLQLELGLDALLRWFDYSLYSPPTSAPGTLGGFAPDTATSIGDSAAGSWLSPAVYAEAEWRPVPGLRLVPGLRVDHDSRLRHGSVWLDPRFSAFVEVADGTTLVGAAGLYGEPPAPQETTRLFGNPDLGWQRAVEYSLGVRQKLPLSADLELTGFYKSLSSLVTPTQALDAQGNLLHLSNGGLGEAYGAELLVRRQLARGLYGWLAYTWSVSSRRDDPTMPSYPLWHLFVFDQTHVMTLVLSYRTSGNWTFGTRVRAVSGNPYTPAAGSLYLADSGRYQCLMAPQPYSARLPGFFQTDARIDKRFVFDKWMFSVYLDVQNVTNHENAEFRFLSYDCSQQVAAPSLPILPTFGLRAEW